MGIFICRFTLYFNPSHISIMFLHFTEAQMYILNHDVLGLCTNDFSSYVDMEFVYLYIAISYSVLREGSKEEQVC